MCLLSFLGWVEGTPYMSLVCWKYSFGTGANEDDVLSGNYKTRTDAVRKCYEAVKPKTSRHNNFTRKEWQNFRFLWEDFIAQTQDNLSQEQYHNSFIIFENCQDKISYVKYIFEKSDERDLLKLEIELLKEFELLLKRDLAPEFRLLIEKRLIELAQKSYYNPEFYNFISILIKHNGIRLKHKINLINKPTAPKVI